MLSYRTICPHCGGNLCGDGITAVLHCENVDESMYPELAHMAPDEGPVYCAEEVEDGDI